MPPRWFCVAVVLAWLGFDGWLVYNDVLPRLRPDQPPPYTIDLVEEAQTRRPNIEWTVHLNGQKALLARTRIEKPETEHDVYELTAEYKPIPGAARVPLQGILIQKMMSQYRVTGSGDLLGLSVVLTGAPQLAQTLKLANGDFTVDIRGTVAAGRMQPTLELQVPGIVARTMTLPAVSVARGSSVLLPLHPVNRLRGLHPGQAWTMRVLDPLADSLGALQGTTSDAPLLRATVRPHPEPFTYAMKEYPCLVIDYQGDNLSGQTWVTQDRGVVLCQDLQVGDNHWVMYRD